MLKNALATVLLRKKTISTLLLMISLLGIISYITFPKEERPEVNLKTVAVVASYQGLVSDDIEKLVTEPLERELMSLEGIKSVISISKDSLVQFMVQFHLNTDEENLSKFVRNKVEDSRSKLPDNVEIEDVREYDSSLFSEIKIGIYGDVPYRILHNVAEEYKSQFETIPNVTEVEINGAKEEIVKITVDPGLLEKHKVNIIEIVNALKSFNNLVPAGILADDNADFSIKVPGLYEDYEELKYLPIRSINNFVLELKDVAKIERSFLERKEYVKVNGYQALGMDVARKPGTNVLALSLIHI